MATASERRVFARFRTIARQHAGIDLKPGKDSLIAARVSRRCRALGLSSPCDYLAHLESDTSGAELVAYLDAISTNVTAFFREPEHFRLLGEVLQGWKAARQRRFRVWCAAAATGEEPYTLAMTMDSALRGCPADYRLLATDLCTTALGRAENGRYSPGALAPVPLRLRGRYFERSTAAGALSYVVKDSLKSTVVFKRLNLAEAPFPMHGPLDAIFCRNVMMYLNAPVRQSLLWEFERLLKPGGLLMIGHAETLMGLRTKLRLLRPSVFTKDEWKEDGRARS